MPVESIAISGSVTGFPEREKHARRESMPVGTCSLRYFLKNCLPWWGGVILMTSFLISRSPLLALQLSTPVLSCRTVYYTAPVGATPSRIEREVMALSATLSYLVEAVEQASRGKDDFLLAYRLPKRMELVIVDEAQRLKMAALESPGDEYSR